jgi:hypothetical protein
MIGRRGALRTRGTQSMMRIDGKVRCVVSNVAFLVHLTATTEVSSQRWYGNVDKMQTLLLLSTFFSFLEGLRCMRKLCGYDVRVQNVALM